MWDDLFAGIALLLVFEGIMPFVNPSRWRVMLRIISEQPDQGLRIMGLCSMLAGVMVLYFVR